MPVLHVAGAIVSIALFFYLLYAMLAPEKF